MILLMKNRYVKRVRGVLKQNDNNSGSCAECGKRINRNRGEGFRVNGLNVCFECLYFQDFIESTDAHLKYVERFGCYDEENSGLWNL